VGEEVWQGHRCRFEPFGPAPYPAVVVAGPLQSGGATHCVSRMLRRVLGRPVWTRNNRRPN